MAFSELSPQAKGLIITALGVLALTPDTLFVRMAELDSRTLLFWRGCCTFLGMAGLTYWQYRGDTVNQFKQVGKLGIGVGILMGCSSICFVLALYYTSVANTLVIISASPMFAALYSRFFLKENVALRTLVTMLIVVCAISFIVRDTGANNSLLGNTIAIMAAGFMAGGFTLMRKGRDRNMVPATALGGLLLITIGLCLAPTLTMSWNQAVIVLAMGTSSVMGFVLITMGTRYITSPEVSLLMPLETVLGSWAVWIILGEAASTTAITGGFVVISALSVHSALSLQKAKGAHLS